MKPASNPERFKQTVFELSYVLADAELCGVLGSDEADALTVNVGDLLG